MSESLTPAPAPRRRSPYKLLLALFIATALVLVAPGSTAEALPPGIPSASAARSQLNALTVKAEGSMSGYSRDKFPHWIAISGNCNTRETVLKRDGTNVTVGTNCYPTSGSWYSNYDGVTLTSPPSVSIDHVVALAEAWRSGASSWSTSKRQSFANSLSTPQLVAVSGSSNSSKGDRDPASWQPSRTAFRCTYARMWIGAKYQWGLSLQSSEKSALSSMLSNYCGT